MSVFRPITHPIPSETQIRANDKKTAHFHWGIAKVSHLLSTIRTMTVGLGITPSLLTSHQLERALAG